MRAVVDTSVLVRAIIKRQGTVAPIISRLRESHFTLLYSAELLEELVEVLDRPRIRVKQRLTDEDIRAVLGVIRLRGEVVVPNRRVRLCRDPDDDKFLEVALAGKADVIVSGDDDLLVLDPFEGIPIVGPAAFLAMLDEAESAEHPGC